MYQKENPEELELKNFYQPFGGKMNEDNRWVKMAKLIPWNVLEEKYAHNFKALGRKAKKKYEWL
jgi:IS5 family transposase